MEEREQRERKWRGEREKERRRERENCTTRLCAYVIARSTTPWRTTTLHGYWLNAAGFQARGATSPGFGRACARSTVRVFTPEGRTVRLAVVPDAHATIVTELPNAGLSVTTAPDGRSDRTMSLVALPSGELLLQMGENTRASEQAGDDYARLVSVMLPTRPGGAARRSVGGAIVAGVAGTRPILQISDPSPGVKWARPDDKSRPAE